MPLFLDACALAKRYIPEGVSTRRMQEITSRYRDWGGFLVSTLIEPEVVAALAKKARGYMSHRDAAFRQHAAVVEIFRRELSRAWFTIVPLDDDKVAGAADLLKTHPEFEIGAADAIHLVTALGVGEEIESEGRFVFVSADRGLAGAARATGLHVYNPTDHTVADLEKLFARR